MVRPPHPLRAVGLPAGLVASEAVARSAAAIAHDLSSPLTTILGLSELLLESDGMSPEQRADLECISRESKRCGRIIQDLLKLPRSENSHREPTERIP